MNCKKIGQLLNRLRKERQLTQKEVADVLNVSDKTVSKWERGLGCPDVSLLHGLSQLFGVTVDNILMGTLDPNTMEGGNMKKIKFYVCSECHNMINSTGTVDVACCGRTLETLVPQEVTDQHEFSIEVIENDYFVTFGHEMKKDHYISFVAYVTFDRVLIIRLYPEQAAQVRFPKMPRGQLYFYCQKDGLFVDKNLKDKVK